MKKYLIFASAVACLVVSGCVKDRKDFADDQVSFSAITGTLDTRTDYGVDGNDGGQSVTYVNWVAGDKIKILSSTGSSDTYTVSEDHDGSDQQGISKGNVNPDNNGIAWGTGQQTFYAMYPANVSGSSLTSSTMTCAIPATWTPTSEAALGQLPYGYMFAKTTTSRTTSVTLTFNPKFTSFTFTLKNPTASAVTLSSFTLSSASKAMNGTYTVNTSNGNVGTLPTAGNNKSITVDLTSLTGGGLSIPAGTTANPGTKTFTLVTVPDTFNDLTISCTIDNEVNSIGLKKNNSFLTFAAGKKHNISITIPGAAPAYIEIDYGGTASGNTFSNVSTSPNSKTQYLNENSTDYVGAWSIPSGYNNYVTVGNNYILIDDAGQPTQATGNVFVQNLATSYQFTPSKIEVVCSGTGLSSALRVRFKYETSYSNHNSYITLYTSNAQVGNPVTLSFVGFTNPVTQYMFRASSSNGDILIDKVRIYY